MASDNSDGSLVDGDIAGDLSINGYEALFEQLQRMQEESELTNRSGDPNEIMGESEQLQKEDYAGIGGALRYGMHKLYGQHWSREDPSLAGQEYESAKQASTNVGRQEAFDFRGDLNRNNLTSLYSELVNAAAVAMAGSPIQGQI